MELPSAIAFDLGDTLCEYAGVPLDWQLEHPPALAAVAERCGHDLTATRLEAGIRVLSKYNTRVTPREDDEEYAAEHIFAEILEQWGAPPECLVVSIQAFFEHFRQTLRAFPESAGVLHRLRQLDVAAGVLTDVPYGMPRTLVLTELSLAGLRRRQGRSIGSTAEAPGPTDEPTASGARRRTPLP